MIPRSLISLAPVVLFASLAVPAYAADDNPKTFPVWPDGVPDSKGTDPKLDVPRFTLYLAKPEKATGAAVVVCPGGGYGGLAMDHEGKQVADWLNGLGIAAVVLQYRLGPRYHHPAPLQDASRTIRTVRARAKEWGLDPRRVAILGFSAGGHLASTAGTHFDAGKADATDPIERESSRPDRMILAYPVIAMATEYTHRGSNRNLLGDNPPPDLLSSLSNETQVSRETPPTFLVHTDADTGVPPENSLLFAMALRKGKVPLELHIFEKGRHGLGLGGDNAAFQAWPRLCETWLKGQGFLTREASQRGGN
jgi:acetyl esterase/lipase